MLARLFFSFIFSATANAGLTYLPPTLDVKNAKIVVVIHGCLQSADAMAMGTGFNRLADKENFVVLYPQVPANSHPLDCWSWFLEENQSRRDGQLKSIVEELNDLRRLYNLPNAPAFAAGISSGGATVAGLLACFPEKFAGGAIHSGTTYGVAKTEDQAKRLLASGTADTTSIKRECDPSRSQRPLLVIHGGADKVVNPANSALIIRDFFGKSLTKTRKTATANGATFETVDFKKNGKFAARLVLVTGLEHAWSGANLNLAHADILGPHTELPFFSNMGPSATNLIWDFFSGL